MQCASASQARRTSGFTLIEVMVVVTIVAILTAVALPQYNDYVKRTKLTEAVATLSDLRVKLEQYYQDNRNYGSTAAVCGVTMPTMKFFTYTCNWGTVATNQGFLITATGGVAGGDQSMAAVSGSPAFIYTIDQGNARATVNVQSGWNGAGKNCWVLRKDGSC